MTPDSHPVITINKNLITEDMKQLFIFTATILACMGMRAQETGIDSVLRQIEANNKELQANAQLISSQKLESRTENNLPDPTLSYAHLWDSKTAMKP